MGVLAFCGGQSRQSAAGKVSMVANLAFPGLSFGAKRWLHLADGVRPAYSYLYEASEKYHAKINQLFDRHAVGRCRNTSAGAGTRG
jgi:hypothetical protein